VAVRISPAAFGGAREVLSRWFATDVAAGRLMPWLPIAFGFGVVVYITADANRRCGPLRGLRVLCTRRVCSQSPRPVAFPLLLGNRVGRRVFAANTSRAQRSRIRSCSTLALEQQHCGFVEGA
jgi:competence protein ComEC